MEFAWRHDRLRDRMRNEGLDAILAYSNAKFQGCVQYVANYAVRFVALNTLPDGSYTAAGSCAALFPTDPAEEGLLLADQRWDTARAKEVSVLPSTEFSAQIGADIGEVIADRGYRRIGIDNWFIFPASHYLALAEKAPGAELVPTQLIEQTYKVKSDQEILLTRKAEEVGVHAMEAAHEAVEVGATEFDIALAADKAMRELGDIELAGGMVVAAGPNSGIGSGVPARHEAYEMKQGDWVMVDICPRYRGYAGDICRMFVAGDVSDVDEFRIKLYTATQAMVDGVIEEIRPGASPKELNELAQRIADEHGVGEYKTTTLGHGVGIDLHDVPDFRWDASPLEPGVCITIEPCLMVPGVTGTRIEELVLVTEGGNEILSSGSGTELRGTAD